MKRLLGTKIERIMGVFFAIIATLILFAPYQQDSTLGYDSLRNVIRISVYILSACIALFSIVVIRFKDIKINSILAIIPALIITAMRLFHNYSYETNIDGLSMILWILFCLSPNNVKINAFKFFSWIWAAICIVGIICFCNYSFGGPIPYDRATYYFGTSNMNYISYGVSFLFQSRSTVRLCGICNEPGYFGTLCALILCAGGFKLKDRKNIIIIIAGILSFSLAFVIITIMYILIKTLAKAYAEKNIRKKLTKYFSITIAILLYVFLLPSVNTGNSSIDSIVERMTLTSEGISGDNRTTEEFDLLFEQALSSNPFFGMGSGYVKESDVGNNLSYKIYIAEYGVLGCLLMWGILLFAVLYKNTKDIFVVAFVMAFFVSIYQRPTIINVPYVIVLLGGVEYIRYNSILYRKTEVSSEITKNH